MMATCQYKVRPQAYTGDEGHVCGRPATHLCELPATYSLEGRCSKRVEYRCSEHLEGYALALPQAQL